MGRCRRRLPPARCDRRWCSNHRRAAHVGNVPPEGPASVALKVVFVTSTFPRDPRDPTGRFIADLVAAEEQAGVEVTVVAPHDAGLPMLDTMGDAEVHRFRYGPSRVEVLAYRGGLMASARRPLGLLMTPAYLVAMAIMSTVVVRRRDADVVHAHWWFPGGLAALVASRLLGRPFVITLHGSDVELAHRRGWRTLGRAVVRRAAAVSAVSESLAAEARLVFGRPDIDVGAMPVPLLQERDRVAPSPPPPPPLRLVAAGRLTREKGFDVLVAAAGLLVDSGIDVRVDLVGSGPEAPRLHASYVHQLGTLPADELRALMAQAHAVVVPSRREGLGLVAVEALALSRPVIASRVGGLPETLAGEALVPPDDPQALADALRCLPDERPRATGHLARHRPDAVATWHAGFYRDLPEPEAWRPMRWFGALVAVALLGGLVRIATRDWPAIRDAWSHPDAVALAVAVLALLVSEAGFGLASARSLRVVSGERRPPLLIASVFWVSQTAKNIPGGVWTALARAGVAKRWGIGPRLTLAWMSTEAVGSVIAGTVIGALALAAAAFSGSAGLPAPAWLAIAVVAAASPTALRAGPAALRQLVTPVGVARVSVAYLGVWLTGAVATAALARAVFPLDGRELLLAGGAACIASIAGFVAVPVPSGIGVREAVLVALLHVVMPTAVAVSVGLGSRVGAILIQTMLAGASLPVVRRQKPLERGPAGIQ